MSKRFIIADIHGSYKGLKQCFERSDFDYKNDLLICLGDTVDGYPEVKECFDELLKIDNLVYVLGNHDEWAFNWMKRGELEELWTSQGGLETLASFGFIKRDNGRLSLNNYKGNINRAGGGMFAEAKIIAEKPLGVEKYLEFLKEAYLYYELENMLFVHGGIDVNQKDIKKQTKDTLLWDRQLIKTAYRKNRFGSDWTALDYDTIFVGHTTTRMFKRGGDYVTKPLHACNVVDMDTGAGAYGKASIMDIDTKEYWQSDYSKELYPDSLGRR